VLRSHLKNNILSKLRIWPSLTITTILGDRCKIQNQKRAKNPTVGPVILALNLLKSTLAYLPSSQPERLLFIINLEIFLLREVKAVQEDQS
jgi:hypothetical protein